MWNSLKQSFFPGFRCRWYGAKACFQGSRATRSREVKPSLRKQMIAKELVDTFTTNRLVTVFHYNDVTCREWVKLRNKLAKHEIKLKVVPSKLSSKVLGMTKYRNLVPLFKGCTAIAYSQDPSPMLHLVSATKSELKLFMLGGVLDNQIFTTEGIHKCAELPPLSVQRSILLRTLTLVQSTLSNKLTYNQQKLCQQIQHMLLGSTPIVQSKNSCAASETTNKKQN